MKANVITDKRLNTWFNNAYNQDKDLLEFPCIKPYTLKLWRILNWMIRSVFRTIKTKTRFVCTSHLQVQSYLYRILTNGQYFTPVKISTSWKSTTNLCNRTLYKHNEHIGKVRHTSRRLVSHIWSILLADAEVKEPLSTGYHCTQTSGDPFDRNPEPLLLLQTDAIEVCLTESRLKKRGSSTSNTYMWPSCDPTSSL